jgi:hypothetical protein
MIDASTLRRFAAKVLVGDGCWIWQGSIDHHGYGRFRYNGKTMGAHQASFDMFVGRMPQGCEPDHTCGTTACVRPDHLDPVTHRENLLRGKTLTALNAAATHCPRNHLYDETNTRLNNGSRICRTCHRERERAKRQGVAA